MDIECLFWGKCDIIVFIDVFTLIDWLIDYKTWFISVVSSDVHSCLFAAITSSKEEEMTFTCRYEI